MVWVSLWLNSHRGCIAEFRENSLQNSLSYSISIDFIVKHPMWVCWWSGCLHSLTLGLLRYGWDHWHSIGQCTEQRGTSCLFLAMSNTSEVSDHCNDCMYFSRLTVVPGQPCPVTVWCNHTLFQGTEAQPEVIGLVQAPVTTNLFPYSLGPEVCPKLSIVAFFSLELTLMLVLGLAWRRL